VQAAAASIDDDSSFSWYKSYTYAVTVPDSLVDLWQDAIS
jgi:hypothetical protein